MDLIQCISERRSSRSYTDDQISDEVLDELIRLGTLAATGSNKQPWGFAILRDKAEIDELSSTIKKHLQEHMDEFPQLKQYESWLTNPKFHVFNRASCVLCIYGDPSSHYYVKDCSLAAANIMLAAYSEHIGTCWIGFAEYMLNTEEFKRQHNIPLHYELVCPMSMGYIKKSFDQPGRKDPLIFCR